MPKHARSDDITLNLPDSVFLSCLELAISSISEAAVLCCVSSRWRQQLLRNCRMRAIRSDWRVMTDDVLKAMSFQSLEELNLSGCYPLTDPSLQSLPKTLRNLNLAGCWNLTNAGVNHVSRLRGLTELNLSYCADISDEIVPVLVGSCTKLERLYFKDCRGVGDEGVQSLCSLTRLVEVDLDGCERVGDEALQALSHVTTLQQLHLSTCKNITDQGLHALSALTELRELNMDHCSNLTAAGMMAIAGLSRMTHMNFNGCRLITHLDWLHAMRGLEELHLV